MSDHRPNRWLRDEAEQDMVRGLIKSVIPPIALVHCTLRAFGEENPKIGADRYALETAQRTLWALCWHVSCDDVLDAARAVMFELGDFIDSITTDKIVETRDEPTDEHGKLRCGHTPDQHAGDFRHVSRHTYLNCCVAGDLDAAMRVLEAVAADHEDESVAFNEILAMGAHVMATMAEGLHQHAEKGEDE